MKSISYILIFFSLELKKVFCLLNKAEYFSIRTEIINEMGLIEINNFISPNRVLCIVKCLDRKECNQLYFNRETQKCILFSGFSTKNNLVTKQSALLAKVFTQNSSSECIKETEYWSIKMNSCLPCPVTFKRYSLNSFSCYHMSQNDMKFFEAKSYCEEKSAFLPRPKTSNERELIRYLSNNTKTWVDSFIDSLGEVYKWGDGTNVTGFKNGQPGNEGDNSSRLNQNVLIISDLCFFDIEYWKTFKTICQIF
ncbi:hypothetical protein BpHYR1_040025 [Brachionus plicatilis]|uniref:C-type lectin domain-containing protein n=1 Tax=Brachionus plicatilis TaxID=10195 RepID=A0A3M7T1W4_BRAPC|nr:hypothetical protein BpHYR1_040025 [Brachionus plicatilis]